MAVRLNTTAPPFSIKHLENVPAVGISPNVFMFDYRKSSDKFLRRLAGEFTEMPVAIIKTQFQVFVIAACLNIPAFDAQGITDQQPAARTQRLDDPVAHRIKITWQVLQAFCQKYKIECLFAKLFEA